MDIEPESAWDEYLAWCRGSSPAEYAQTEELAWRRLNSARLSVTVSGAPELLFPPAGSPPEIDPPTTPPKGVWGWTPPSE